MNNTDRLCMGCMNDNGGETICPICGYNSSQKTDPSFLAPKTWIKDRYLVGRVCENNGEGVTYIGWDNLKNTVVYIREYFPIGLCTRNKDGSVSITEGKEYDFNNGVMEFLEISRTLDTLAGLPCIMPVVETIELGATAYSIVKAAAGISLREFLMRNGGTLKWEQAKPLFMPLITTLEGMHKAGIIHRGISPETIIVGRDGKMHLTGICIPQVRTATSEITSQIFPGFAAVEQYGLAGTDGKWTDVYGVAATLFRVLIGNPPLAANERFSHDNMSIPAKMAETIPPYVLTALANALQILPENRTQNMTELRNDLSVQGNTAAVPKTVDTTAKTDENNPEYVAQDTPKKNKHYAVMAAGATAGVLLVIAAILIFTVFRSEIFGKRGNDKTSSLDAPSVASYGETDSTLSDPGPVEKLYAVPNLVGTLYSGVIENIDYIGIFKFNITKTELNNDFPEGTIIHQSVKSGTEAKKDTTIDVIISAGSSELSVPSIAGRSQIEAYIALLELGFSKDNIEFIEKYDETQSPQSVISTEPAAKTKVSRFSKIQVFVNSYEGELPEDYDTYSSQQ